MHHAIGFGLLVALVAFAFGERTARVFVGTALLAGAALFLYVMFRIVSGTI